MRGRRFLGGRRVPARQGAGGGSGTAFLQLLTLNAWVESGSSLVGYGYSTPSASSAASGATKSLAALADGSFQATVGTYTGHTAIIGFSSVNNNAFYTDMLYGLFGTSTTGFYTPILSNTFPAANGNASVPRATGDIVRFTRTGTNLVAAVSKDVGATWTTVHTFSGATTAQLFPVLATAVSAVTVPLISGSGLT